jgi:hypothetical protein
MGSTKTLFGVHQRPVGSTEVQGEQENVAIEQSWTQLPLSVVKSVDPLINGTTLIFRFEIVN